MILAGIMQTVQFLCEVGRQHKALVVLQAFFDESGTHARAESTVIAGFVGTAEQWVEVERLWAEHLAKHDIPDFHYHEFENRVGPWEKMDREIRTPIMKGLMVILIRSGLIPVAAAYHGKWGDIEPKNPLWKPDRFPNAYSWCFELCMESLIDCSRDVYGSEPVSVMFALHDEYGERALKYFDLFKRNREWQTLVHPIAFDSPKSRPALQAADMIAFEIYQAFNSRRMSWLKLYLLGALWSMDTEENPIYSKYVIFNDNRSLERIIEKGPTGFLEHSPSRPEPGTAVFDPGQRLDPDPWQPSPEGLAWWTF